MTFWILLSMLTIAAVALSIWPLLFTGGAIPALNEHESRLAVLRDRRDELERDRAAGRLTDDEAASAQQELVDSLAQSLTAHGNSTDTAHTRNKNLAPAIALAVFVPLLALGTYLKVGQPQLGAYLAQVDPPQPPSSGEVDAMIAQLKQRTAENPQDGETWLTLAQAHSIMGNGAAASQAYEQAIKFIPPNADVLADYANLLAQQNNGSLQGRPAELLERAIKVAPNNIKVIAMLGGVYMQSGQDQKALPYLKRFLAAVDPASSEAAEINKLIARIEGQSPVAPTAINTQANITGKITLSGEPPTAGTTLFIVVRAAQGPRIPYAVIRQSTEQFPMTFEIGDANLMNPARKLSEAGDVIVEARISSSGQAMRQSGDRYGVSVVTRPGSKDIAIQIDQQVP